MSLCIWHIVLLGSPELQKFVEVSDTAIYGDLFYLKYNYNTEGVKKSFGVFSKCFRSGMLNESARD